MIRILLAEDGRDLNRYVAACLRAEGYEERTAAAEARIEAARKRR